MFARFRARVNHATVVAYLALFVALGGSGYAAVNINGSQLKNRSVAGKKLKKNTLTGTEIKESKLGKVPRAKHADSAGLATSANNASMLAGRPASGYASAACPHDMVRVGPTCIDRYEASVWSSPTGGTQYGVSSADYPCNADGQDCTNIYARSVPGVKPSAYITYFQAQQALANSGKRLPTNAEWQSAVAGTPDSTACNVSAGSVANTGANAGCVSRFGAFDMVGNVWEWVADWGDNATGCASWPSGFGSDSSCVGLGEGETNFHLPGALIRGGTFGSGTAAGPFDVNAVSEPSSSGGHIGFRGAR
jgi:Sulfatase-modifying factor enzyme 1